MKLFGDTITTLENGLNYSSAKNRAISSNIANVDTPGYKARKVEFRDMLASEMSSVPTKKTNDRHIDFQGGAQLPYKTFNASNTMYNHNGNNVDIEKEMNDLAKNQIYFQALVSRMSSKFRGLESVIRGGN